MLKQSTYSVKNVSADAVVSCLLAGMSIACIVGAVVASCRYEGKGPAVIGLAGVGGWLLSLAGIVFSVSAWKSVNGGIRLKRTAVILNVVMFIVTTTLYITGWF